MTGSKIRIGIAGYGNLGRGVALAVQESPDMELKAVFSRRPAESLGVIHKEVPVVAAEQAKDYVEEIDVVILCTGSANDLPKQGPDYACLFNTVDGYDNHSKIPNYRNSMDLAAKSGKKTSAICIGWDPGLFSISRVLFDAILEEGSVHTFWGPGVSQGHSDAIRRIEGVKDAIQYTIPVEETIEKIRKGEKGDLSNREKHTRRCFVVLDEKASPDEIESKIKTMPAYFADYDTEVNFVSEEELKEKHSKLFHGGFVVGGCQTGTHLDHQQTAEFSLKLDSNPEFTARVLVAYARAAYRLNQEGIYGAKTILDIPIKYISAKRDEDLYKEFL